MKIVIATQNPGKVKEIKSILKELEIEVMSATEAGITTGAVEDGDTVEENAKKKAQFVVEKIKLPAIADDAGLFIDALEGKPGVHSARWAGPDSTDNQKLHKLLDEMKGVPLDRRTAVFKSAVALSYPGKDSYIFTGQCPGNITDVPRGTPRKHMPYDLLFKPDGCTQTFAEMTDDEKNAISHRAMAFTKLIHFLKENK